MVRSILIWLAVYVIASAIASIFTTDPVSIVAAGVIVAAVNQTRRRGPQPFN